MARRRRRLVVSAELGDRLDFLGLLQGEIEDETVARALRLLDRTGPTVWLEGSRLMLHHRDGTREEVIP